MRCYCRHRIEHDIIIGFCRGFEDERLVGKSIGAHMRHLTQCRAYDVLPRHMLLIS